MKTRKENNERRKQVEEICAQLGVSPTVSQVKTFAGRAAKTVGTPLLRIMEQIHSGKYERECERVSRAATIARLNDQPHNGRLAGIDQLPYIVFGANLKPSADSQEHRLTGLLLMTIDCPHGEQQARAVKRAAIRVGYTLAAFIGSSRRTVKVLLYCTDADNRVPQDETRYLRMMSRCAAMAADVYRDMGNIHFRRELLRLDSGCRMSADKEAYFNDLAFFFHLSADSTDEDNTSQDTEHTDNTASDHDATLAQQQLRREEFYTCLQKALDEQAGDEGDTLTLLAALCRRAGLEEEESVTRTMRHPYFNASPEMLVRKVFRTVYCKPATGKGLSQMSEKERIARQVEQFFRRRYELRYNVMKQTEEFRPHNGFYKPWRQLTDRQLKRIAFEQMKDVGVAWSIDVELYVRSALVTSYNPVTEFLDSCNHWDRRSDPIRQLARCVPTADKLWPDRFHRWFLAMVAQWMQLSRDHGNTVVPLLIGDQGTHKTTFCRLLLPPSLREYFIDDVKLENVEQTERMLSRMLLVNIDEYNAKTDREQAKIKRLLAEKDVQTRRMRSEHYELRPRMASFIATTNDPQPLTDPTGSRRYLCCLVTGNIDTSAPVDYQQLYGQAVWELRHGERYHFTREEEAAIEENNRQFYRMSSPEELLLCFFQPAKRDKRYFLRATDILQVMATHLSKSDLPNIKALTLALRNAHFQHGAINGQRGWYAEQRRE